MDSTNLHRHTLESVLCDIDAWYMKEGVEQLKNLRFDICIKDNLSKYKVIKAHERMLRRNLECDFEITESILERVNLLI